MIQSGLDIAKSESRIHRTALWIGAALLVAYWIAFQTWLAALSVLLGSALAWINFRWLSTGIGAVIIPANRKKIKYLILRFFLRLVLILVVLYAMIRVSLVGAVGVLVGLSIYVLAVLAEAAFSLLLRAKK